MVLFSYRKTTGKPETANLDRKGAGKMHCRIGNVGKPPVNSGKGLNLGGKIMNNKIKVLIGSDTADCGMA